MAVKAVTRTEVDGGGYLFVWAAMASGDTGDPVSIVGAADKTIQLTAGTFGDGTLTMQGSLDTTPVTYFTLTDAHANAATYTAVGGDTITEGAIWVRPSLSGTTGTGVIVKMLARSTRK